jgi:hypothetical protein
MPGPPGRDAVTFGRRRRWPARGRELGGRGGKATRMISMTQTQVFTHSDRNTRPVLRMASYVLRVMTRMTRIPKKTVRIRTFHSSDKIIDVASFECMRGALLEDAVACDAVCRLMRAITARCSTTGVGIDTDRTVWTKYLPDPQSTL